jgi:hypothetical protein
MDIFLVIGFLLWLICWGTFIAVAIVEHAFEKKFFCMGVILSVVLFFSA